MPSANGLAGTALDRVFDSIWSSCSSRPHIIRYRRSFALADSATSVQEAMSAVFRPYAGVSVVTEDTEADVPSRQSADAFQNCTVMSM